MTSMDRALMKAIEHVEEKVDSGTSSGSHTHVITDITNLQSKLDTMESKITAISQSGGSSSDGTTSTTVIAHTHTIDNIINLQTELDKITALTKEVPYHSHEIGSIVNLSSYINTFTAQIAALESSSAAVAYPIGTIYFTTNTDIVSPRDTMVNTRWVKVKSPLTNYTAWQRCAATYVDANLLEEWFKVYFPIGSSKTFIDSDSASTYVNSITTTNNYATLTQSTSPDWGTDTTISVQNDKLCQGLVPDKSNETTTGMIGDCNLYLENEAKQELDIFYPVGAIIFFKDGKTATNYALYFNNNLNCDNTHAVEYTQVSADGTVTGKPGYYYVKRTK